MKVCIINNLFLPFNRGGAEEVVRLEIEEFLRLGYKVTLITCSPKGDSQELKDNLRIYRLAPHNLYFYSNGEKYFWFTRLLWHFIDVFNFGVAKKVGQILQKEKPNVVHTHNLMGLGFLLPRIIQKLDIFHIHSIHDVQLLDPSGLVKNNYSQFWRWSPFRILYAWMVKKLLGRPELVLSSSFELLSFYKNLNFFNKIKTEVLRNPVQIESGIILNKNQADFNFLYLGQIEKHKGLELLASTFKKLLKTNPGNNYFLHIYGKGSFEDGLKRMIEKTNQIIFHGMAERKDLPAVFNKAHVLVMPTLVIENTPMVISESLANGVPVLVSDAKGASELIVQDQNGWVFNSGDEVDLLRKMSHCLDNKEKIFAKAMVAKNSVQDFGVEKYVAKLISFFPYGE